MLLRGLAQLLLCAGALARAQMFQQWSEVDLTWSTPSLTVTAPLVGRTSSSGANPVLAASGALLEVAVQRHLAVTVGYLGVDIPAKVGWVNVPLVAVTPSLTRRRVTLADRNRFEWLGGYGDNAWRYRNRGLIDVALGRSGRFHAFADDEFFFNVTDRNWNQNRLQMGAGARLDPRTLLDVYFLQKNATGGAAPTHVLGVTLRLNIGPRAKRPVVPRP